MIQILQKIFIIILYILWGSFSFADVEIKITHGVNSAYPIAIMPFTNLSQKNFIISEDITSIINSDLNNSGKFNVLPISHLPNKPVRVSDIIPMFWKKLGINIIVLGTIEINNDNNYIITYQLVDSSSNPALIILENQYFTEEKLLRHTAHAISNEIFEKITGIKGIFCSSLAYIIKTSDIKYPYELCISDYDCKNRISICQSPEPLMSPTWSPDGEKIAYVTFSSGSPKLVIQTLNTGLIRNVINFPQHNGAPVFSPDGKKLAFSSSKTGSLNLYVINLKSGKIQQLTNNRNNNTEPSWFPDNENLAYTSDQSGVPQIYKININSNTEIKRLSWLRTSNQNPSVSLDGKFIIMINRFAGHQNIAKLNLLTGEEKILTHTFLDETPNIAPNNAMLAYSTVKESTSVLALVSVDGEFNTYFQNATENLRFPVWSPLKTY